MAENSRQVWDTMPDSGDDEFKNKWLVDPYSIYSCILDSSPTQLGRLLRRWITRAPTKYLDNTTSLKENKQRSIEEIHSPSQISSTMIMEVNAPLRIESTMILTEFMSGEAWAMKF